MRAASRRWRSAMYRTRLERGGSCGGAPGEIVESFGEKPACFRGLLGGEHAHAVMFEPVGRNAGGVGGTVERPAEMLARMATADRRAVMLDHLVIHGARQRVLLGERWGRFAHAG